MKLSGFALVAALAIALVAGENETPRMKSVENDAVITRQEQGKALGENEGDALRGLEELKDGNENFENDGASREEQWGHHYPGYHHWPGYHHYPYHYPRHYPRHYWPGYGPWGGHGGGN